MTSKLEFVKKISRLQSELSVPKNQFNAFGKYSYRSCEDIMQAIKPLAAELGLVVMVRDQVEQIGERYYIRADVFIKDVENEGHNIQGSAYARESETKKGMDSAQITGAASSYARKYALAGLLCLDDGKDADDENRQEEPPPQTEKPKPKPKLTPTQKKDIISQKDRMIEEITRKLKEMFGEDKPGRKDAGNWLKDQMGYTVLFRKIDSEKLEDVYNLVNAEYTLRSEANNLPSVLDDDIPF